MEGNQTRGWVWTESHVQPAIQCAVMHGHCNSATVNLDSIEERHGSVSTDFLKEFYWLLCEISSFYTTLANPQILESIVAGLCLYLQYSRFKREVPICFGVRVLRVLPRRLWCWWWSAEERRGWQPVPSLVAMESGRMWFQCLRGLFKNLLYVVFGWLICICIYASDSDIQYLARETEMHISLVMFYSMCHKSTDSGHQKNLEALGFYLVNGESRLKMHVRIKPCVVCGFVLCML